MKHKKLISFLLSAAMVFSMGISVSAATTSREAHVNVSEASGDFVISDGILSEYKGSGGDVVIPNTVKRIADGAFCEAFSMKSLTIPASVTVIEENAFGLTEGPQSTFEKIIVASDNSKYSSKDGVLYNKSKTALILCPIAKSGSLTIPGTVTKINNDAFYDCYRLTGVVIPNSVTTIGDYAFSGSSISNVTIPASVTSIGDGAFNYCHSLTGISVNADNPNYSSKNGVLYNKKQTKLIRFPGGKSGCFTVPSSVTVIEESAFSGSSKITRVTIPSSVTTINAYSFIFCGKLKTLDLEGISPKINQIAFDVDELFSESGDSATKLTAVYYAGTQTQWKSAGLNKIFDSSVKVTYSCKPITISTQPKSVTLEEGKNASFTVKATGSSLKYQWYYKKSGDSSWTLWSNHTAATLSLTASSAWNKAQFYCRVTDSTGKYVNSNAAALTVSAGLKITKQPVSVTTKANKLVRFSVEAQGTGLTYQWYYKKKDATSWSIWKIYTTSVIEPPANNTWDGLQARCLVKDANGQSVYSNAATVTIVPYASGDFQITSQPKSVSISVSDVGNKQISFSVATKNGTGLKYQWYFCKANAASWSEWKGHTHASESVTPNATWDKIQLYCKITDSNGEALYSDLAKVTFVGNSLAITAQPVNKSVTLGSSVTLSLQAQGSGLTYQWYFKKSGQTSFTAWNGRTHASETVTPNSTWDGIQLYCLVKDSSGNSVKSNIITVTVKSTLAITTQPVNKSITLGDSVTLSLKAQGSGLTYQWYFKKAGQTSFSAWSGRTHASETVTPPSSWNGIQLYCLVKDSTGKSVKSNTITVSISGITTLPRLTDDNIRTVLKKHLNYLDAIWNEECAVPLDYDDSITYNGDTYFCVEGFKTKKDYINEVKKYLVTNSDTFDYGLYLEKNNKLYINLFVYESNISLDVLSARIFEEHDDYYLIDIYCTGGGEWIGTITFKVVIQDNSYKIVLNHVYAYWDPDLFGDDVD